MIHDRYLHNIDVVVVKVGNKLLHAYLKGWAPYMHSYLIQLLALKYLRQLLRLGHLSLPYK